MTILRELKEAFAPHGFLLTAAVAAGADTINSAYDVSSIGRYFRSIQYLEYLN